MKRKTGDISKSIVLPLADWYVENRIEFFFRFKINLIGTHQHGDMQSN